MPKSVSFTDPYAQDYAELARKQKLAEILGQQAIEPAGNTEIVSGWAVPQGPLQGLSKVAQAGLSAYMMNKTGERERLLAEKVREGGKKDAADFITALQGTPAKPSTYEADTFDEADKAQLAMDMGTPAVAGDKNKALAIALGAGNPMVQQAGSSLMADMLKPKKPIVLGKTLVDPETYEPVAVDQTWQADQAAARAQKIEELKMRLEDQRLNREQQADLRRELAQQQEAMRRDLAAQASADRRMIAGQSSSDRMAIAQMADAARQQKNTPQLPTPALKMQQEELDAIGTSATIKADLSAIKAQVDSGELELGPVKNLLSAGKNMAGLSDENSRNFGTFKSTLEKLRNDSLRLNNGVQTEGDAIRAWNELLANINDPKLVSKRLGEIEKINDRAANIRRMKVDDIRQNYQLGPMETSKYENQPAVVGTPSAPAGAKVKRFNPATGRIE